MARTDQPHKVTFDDFVARSTDFANPVNEKHRDLDYSRPESRAAWNGSKSKLPIWCNVHETFFVQQAANHMNGQGCPQCGVKVYKDKRRKDDPIADFKLKHGDKYDYSKVVYENSKTPVEIICPAHGSFMQKPNNHLNGEGCPVCWENRRKAFGAQKTVDYKATFAERSARVHNGKYAVLSLPDHSHDMVRLLCPEHGEFQQKAYSHLDGFGCWSCGQNTNFSELAVAEFIKSLGVKVEHENRTVLDGLHIDIWVPEKKIGVEYHGMFWHTVDRVGDKHREKYRRATEAGIKLIQIFDFEWQERQIAVKNRLRALFSDDKAIAARKCEVLEIPHQEARAFFKVNHTQGGGLNPDVAYGLFYEKALVACMSFGANRTGGLGWELLRYASIGRVQGGFSRLFSAFVADRNPHVITSYCDLRWGDGTVYKNNGFTLDGVTPPDYWYVDKRGVRIPRQKLQKRPEGKTEKEFAEEMGYGKVRGVGHQRWVWRPG